ncbi:MAG: tRNA pseudouridine(13) synthase TruD [Candidatus Woesearchaeota archaeon]
MKIKQAPDDFVVKEVLDLKLEDGPYTYFILKKKNWNTLDAISEIAKKMNVSEKMINFAGIKDKHAVTEQIASVFRIGKGKLESLHVKDIEIKILGTGKEKVHTAMLVGNEFAITVRDLDEPNEKRPNHVANYFDGQRFGTGSDNHVAGKALVMKEFKKACEIMKLEAEGNDYVGVLRKNPRLLKLIFHSYQSYLFNLALAEYVRIKSKKCYDVKSDFGTLVFSDYYDDIEIPLLQFDTELSGEVKKIYEKIMKAEGLSMKDFIIRQLPDLLSSTLYRKAFAEVKDFSSEISDDELNPGKRKQVLEFMLPKGSYATIVVKSLYPPKE